MTFTVTYRNKSMQVMTEEIEADDKAAAFFKFSFTVAHSWIIKITEV